MTDPVIDSPERSPLGELENPGEFIARHIGPSEDEIAHMLSAVGADSLDALTESTLPPDIQDREDLDLAPPLGEHAALERLKAIARENELRHNMIGLGYSETLTRRVIERLSP